MGDERSARNGHVHVVLDQAGCFAAWRSRRFSMEISRPVDFERSLPGVPFLSRAAISRELAAAGLGAEGGVSHLAF